MHRELTEGIRSLPGWYKKVYQKKIETHRKIIKGNRKACRELQNRHKPKIKLRHQAKDLTMLWEPTRSKVTMRLATGEARGCWFAGVR
ncbi:hypothetical protein B296_00040080 [Ensete ventricosum]|uniref:Uncharacterized protein n=1 Tax=Ensete ventricosum TaxID=4639 RepID=A0A426X7Q2_ENSVE|nr:hypothetical protein B296_00040080 [Ensete ventricosum]